MTDHLSTPAHGLRHSLLAVVIIAAGVLLLLLALTPAAQGSARRGMDTWYNSCDVAGAWGWSVSTDGNVIIWPQGPGVATVWPIGAQYDLQAIDMLTTRVGYVVAVERGPFGAKVFKTTDGGRQWTVKKTASVDLLAAVRFRSVKIGWVAGRNGMVLKTTNGGKTWVKQRTRTTATLYSLAFPNDKVGYAVGSGGTIVKTTDGGQTWSKKRSGTTETLYSVDFVTPSIGWAAGGDSAGVCLKTTNGGKTWKPQGTALPPLAAVDFATSTSGWAIGNAGTWPDVSGKLYKVTGGGAVWTDQSSSVDPSPPDYGLTALRATSPNGAYAEGESEACLYVDDGLIWHLVHIATP
jgi:photosystem II stability/assembly factor-like uncharacterized protein